MYFRFYHKIMRDAGMVHSDEPATKLLCQGMVINETYYREDTAGERHWFNPKDVAIETDSKGKPLTAVLTADGQPVEIGNVEKMSKSKNNGVDPHSMIERYGADTVRLFVMFAAPPDQHVEWSESGVEGAWRFLKRIWSGVYTCVEAGPAAAVDASVCNGDQRNLRREIHRTIAKVTDDIGRRNTFNTAIAAVMELSNHLNRYSGEGEQDQAVLAEGWQAVVMLLAPVIPHICEHLWQALGHDEALHSAAWPLVDEAALVQDTVTVVVQVNGKLRARVEVAADADQEHVQQLAMGMDNVDKFIAGATVRKVIYIPGKLLNIVAA
jgi:leucyl-tRNA synthetase